MAYGLGSRRTNRITMAVYALIAVGWSLWRLFDYGRSSSLRVAVAPVSGTPPTELFGGQLRAGNAVELNVEKSDVSRLIGVIDFLAYSEIVVTLVLIVVGMLFLYRFCDRVIDGRAFERGATLDLAVVAGCLVFLPFIGGMLRQMVTNSVASALELQDAVDASHNFDGMFVAVIFAVFLQFVYATVQQGSTLAKDAEGLV